jgi:hypothetical protein
MIMRQENYVEKTAALWTQQMDRWMESANLYQSHAQKFAEMVAEQAMEAQKENQKFVKAWSDSVAKSQLELWKTWQANMKEASAFFTPEMVKEGKA